MAESDLAAFFDLHAAVARIHLTRVQGSSPRAAGTEMFVAERGLSGTIGGGQLEHLAIAEARRLLARGGLSAEMDIPLGPEIGQCCGGRVALRIARMRSADKRDAIERASREAARHPHVYVLGAGHVGRALAGFLALLPVRTILIDMRAEELAQCAVPVELRQSAIPEVDIATAPPGSAFVVLTHDHGLDFLLASAALARGDAGYVGMIGSATKRAKFARWCRDHCDGQTSEALTCPIGASASDDKRPAVIAALVAAEVIGRLTGGAAALERPQRPAPLARRN